MSNKVKDFQDSISLRSFLDELITEKDNQYDYFLKATYFFGKKESPIRLNTPIRNVQIVWVGNNFFVEGDIESQNSSEDTHIFVPFNFFSWARSEPIIKDNIAILDPNGGTISNDTISFTKTGYIVNDEYTPPLKENYIFSYWSTESEDEESPPDKTWPDPPSNERGHKLYAHYILESQGDNINGE